MTWNAGHLHGDDGATVCCQMRANSRQQLTAPPPDQEWDYVGRPGLRSTEKRFSGVHGPRPQKRQAPPPLHCLKELRVRRSQRNRIRIAQKPPRVGAVTLIPSVREHRGFVFMGFKDQPSRNGNMQGSSRKWIFTLADSEAPRSEHPQKHAKGSCNFLPKGPTMEGRRSPTPRRCMARVEAAHPAAAPVFLVRLGTLGWWLTELTVFGFRACRQIDGFATGAQKPKPLVKSPHRLKGPRKLLTQLEKSRQIAATLEVEASRLGLMKVPRHVDLALGRSGFGVLRLGTQEFECSAFRVRAQANEFLL